MCHRDTDYEFAVLDNNDLGKIQEAEKAISQNNGNVILLAYKKANDNMMDR